MLSPHAGSGIVRAAGTDEGRTHAPTFPRDHRDSSPDVRAGAGGRAPRDGARATGPWRRSGLFGIGVPAASSAGTAAPPARTDAAARAAPAVSVRSRHGLFRVGMPAASSAGTAAPPARTDAAARAAPAVSVRSRHGLFRVGMPAASSAGSAAPRARADAAASVGYADVDRAGPSGPPERLGPSGTVAAGVNRASAEP